MSIDDRFQVVKGDATWHDGPGWYYVDVEYPDEGSCGAFATKEAAIAHAREVYADEAAAHSMELRGGSE